jgi:hypothetical protein
MDMPTSESTNVLTIEQIRKLALTYRAAQAREYYHSRKAADPDYVNKMYKKSRDYSKKKQEERGGALPRGRPKKKPTDEPPAPPPLPKPKGRPRKYITDLDISNLMI